MKMPTLALTLLAVATPTWCDTPTAGQLTPDQVVEQFRTDLQAKRADVMAKGLKLTAEQAAKFWPLFEQFQKEQSAIVDGQLSATQKYADHFSSLSDTDALEYVNA